jgi:serine/threonine-protein kinase RsbT
VSAVLRVAIAGGETVPRAVLGAQEWALAQGLSEVDSHRVALVVSELATNQVKYARGRGEVILRRCERGRECIEIEALDQGPGIADVEWALAEHTSTGGSLGLGLPGVKRLMDELHIDTSPGGTRVTVRKWWP